ncbi:MAG: GntR family transcriptional regulator [Lautropia sp.]
MAVVPPPGKLEELAPERVYESIKEAIISLRLKPGQRLRAAQIGKWVNASRTPVREALGRLAQEGLVDRDEGWGYVVRPISAKDVLDLFSVREALEVQAARELIPHLTAAGIGELVELNAQAEAAFLERRSDDFLAINRSFHKLIARLAGNRLLEQMLGTTHDRVRLVGALTLQLYPERAEELLTENRQILAAIRARDASALEHAVALHIRRGRQHVRRLLVDPEGSAVIPLYR